MDACNEHESSHTHEKNSKWNRRTGFAQLIAGVLTSNWNVLTSGAHNLTDGAVHGLRHKAEHSKKLRYPLLAAGVLGCSAIALSSVEKKFGLDETVTSGIITYSSLAWDSAMNTSNFIKTMIRMPKGTRGKMESIAHNGVDAGISLTALFTALLHSVGAIEVDNAAGKVHVGALFMLSILEGLSGVGSYFHKTAGAE